MAKSGLKRERRFNRAESSPQATSNEDLRDESVGSNGPAAAELPQQIALAVAKCSQQTFQWVVLRASDEATEGSGFGVQDLPRAVAVSAVPEL